MTKSEVYEKAKQVFSKYKGKVVEDEEHITLINRNKLNDKVVECKVGIHQYISSEDNCLKFGVDGIEETCEIIGGCSLPCDTLQEIEDRLIYCLERYNYTKQTKVSLFDFSF